MKLKEKIFRVCALSFMFSVLLIFVEYRVYAVMAIRGLTDVETVFFAKCVFYVLCLGALIFTGCYARKHQFTRKEVLYAAGIIAAYLAIAAIVEFGVAMMGWATYAASPVMGVMRFYLLAEVYMRFADIFFELLPGVPLVGYAVGIASPFLLTLFVKRQTQQDGNKGDSSCK